MISIPINYNMNRRQRFKINGKNVNNIRFADVILFLTESAEAIKQFIEAAEETYVKYSVFINVRKIETIFISIDKPVNPHIAFLIGLVEKVRRIIYLEAWHQQQ